MLRGWVAAGDLREGDPETRQIAWTWLKDDPGNPTLSHMRVLIRRLDQVRAWNTGAPALDKVADVKIQHFAQEARSLDATRMHELAAAKRSTLAVAFVWVLTAQAHDDLATISIRWMQTIHTKAAEALEQYRLDYRARTDRLIVTLRDTVIAHR